MLQTDADTLVTRSARSVRSVEPLVGQLAAIETMTPAVWQERGYLDPREDEALWMMFSCYLTARAVLREATSALAPIALSPHQSVSEDVRLRAFVVGYAAACQLVAGGRQIVRELGAYDVVRRKLNEARPQLGIPRKQYVGIYRSLTHPANVWRLRQAKQFAESHAAELEALVCDGEMGPMLEIARQNEEALQVDASEYLGHRLRYRLHSWRRRNASAAQRATFWLLEGSGRLVSNLRPRWVRKRVNSDVLRQLAALLEPGDVIVTRHRDAPSNLFLPGYWPHAALYLGPPETRERLGLEVDDDRAGRWRGEIDVLEAQRDGVQFRPLAETLSVDAVAIIRPRLAAAALARSLERALVQEGKLYDFSFDFTRSDRVVCTELVYRAYHEPTDALAFELLPRSGRLTVSAEQLLDMALDNRGFEVVAVFGTPDSKRTVVTGPGARRVLEASYRRVTTEAP